MLLALFYPCLPLFFYIWLGIQAAVFYRISDPEKAVLTVGDALAIEKLVKETSTATLQVIVRSTALNQVAQSKAISAVPHDDEPPENPNAPLFFGKSPPQSRGTKRGRSRKNSTLLAMCVFFCSAKRGWCLAKQLG
jgi:hypothetical protein